MVIPLITGTSIRKQVKVVLSELIVFDLQHSQICEVRKFGDGKWYQIAEFSKDWYHILQAHDRSTQIDVIDIDGLGFY
jgi:hypothetical protein